MFSKFSIFNCGIAASILNILALLVGCESPTIIDDEEPRGNLRVNVFQIEQTPFSDLSRSALTDAFTRLNFAVYTMDGSRVKQVNQTSSEADFGKAVFQLEEGDYQLVVVGHSSKGNPTMTNPAKIQFTNATGYTDTFFSREEFTIGAEPVNLDLTLNRNVSLCRFEITDSYPADASKIRFYYTGGSGAFDAKTGLGCVKSKQDVTFDLSSGQKQFDLYTFLHDAEATLRLTVTVYNSKDNVLYEHTFPEVPMQKNHITTLSGDCFGGNAGAVNINITINTDWAGETHLTF